MATGKTDHTVSNAIEKKKLLIVEEVSKRPASIVIKRD